MPFAQHTEDQPRRTARSPFSPLRRWRNDDEETVEQASTEQVLNGLEDGRPNALAAGAATTAVPADGHAPRSPVLAPGSVLVAYDGGAAGRTALKFASSALSGTLAIVHFWAAVDPLRALRGASHPGAGAHLLHTVYLDNERGRAEAESIVAAAVAIAQEAGRDAIGLARREDDTVCREARLRALVQRHRVGHLVLAATPRSWWRRLLLGPGTAERLAANPPCPCTIVPVDAV